MDKEPCKDCRDNVLSLSFFFQIFGTVFKLVLGILAGSQVLVADAIHSSTDIFAYGINYYGAKKHSSANSVMWQSFAIGTIMFFCGIWIFSINLDILVAGTPVRPGALCLVAVVCALFVNLYLVRIAKCVSLHMPSDKNASLCLIQSRTNFFSSVVAFAGVLLADLGVVEMDPISALIIGVVQFFGALEVFIEGFQAAEEEKKYLLKIQLASVLLMGSLSIAFIYGVHINETLYRRHHILIPADTSFMTANSASLLGRANYFHIIDEELLHTGVIANEAKNFTGDVSDHFLAVVEDKKVGVVIAQKIGYEMFHDLRDASVKMYYIDKPTNIAQVYALYDEGKLEVATAPNVDKGFGLDRVRWLTPW